MDSKWFNSSVQRPKVQMRLFCLPYAGGSATIYTLLDPSNEVTAIQPSGATTEFLKHLTLQWQLSLEI